MPPQRTQIRVAGLAVALVVPLALVTSGGCSYDWTIGGETPAAPSAGSTAPTPTPGSPVSPGTGNGTDSGTVDSGSGNPVPGQTTECGPKCGCADKQTCNFTCKAGNCSMACTGNSICKIACARGADCTLACKDNASCNVDCTAGTATCDLACTGEATCAGSCKAGSLCSRDCDGKHCSVDCSGGGICL